MVPRCCENGRPILTDPHTGQTICSCQYNPGLLSYPRVPGLAEGMYGGAGFPGHQGLVTLTPDVAAAAAAGFYSPLAGSPYDAATLAHSGVLLPYEATMAGYPYGPGFGPMDLNAARRKNATKEATNTLKAWLYEHRKNPYPTKGEKIMLAIITKMTLTQVSTWFANARRRLKKENKMTWSPRNRSEDDDDDDDDLDDKDDGDERADGRKKLFSDSLSDKGDDDRKSDVDNGDLEINVDDLPDTFTSDDESPHSSHEDPKSRLTDVTARTTVPSSLPLHLHRTGNDVRTTHIQVNGRKRSHSPDSRSEDSPKPKIWSITNVLETKSSPENKDSSSDESHSPQRYTLNPSQISSHLHSQGFAFLSGKGGATHTWIPGSYSNQAMFNGHRAVPLGNPVLSHNSYPYPISSSATTVPLKSTLHPVTSLSRPEHFMAHGLIHRPGPMPHPHDLSRPTPLQNGLDLKRVPEQSVLQ